MTYRMHHLEANIKKFEREMARSRQATDGAMRGVERRTQQATQRIEGMMTRAGRTINTALSGMLAGLSVQQVSQFADSYTKVQNALKVAGLEGQKLAGTYNELFAIAQRHGAALESMATLYGRVSLAQKDLNATSAQVMSLTNNVALALVLNELNGEKPSQSRVLWGNGIAAAGTVISGLIPVAQAFGLITEEESSAIIQGFGAIVALGGVAYSVYGRLATGLRPLFSRKPRAI